MIKTSVSGATAKFFATRRIEVTEMCHVELPGPISEQQEMFLGCDTQIAVALGGNGSGKSECGAQWFAERLRHAPPRPLCPAWIVGVSYDMVCGISWQEKLSKYIHESQIDDYVWYDRKRRFPHAVILKNGWVIETKSMEQGRESFQARSIGMCWIDEQIDEYIFEEILARTRDYSAPIRYTLTPLEPDDFLQSKYENPPQNWSFFKFDIDDNRASHSYKGKSGKLDDKWVDLFASGLNENFKATRLRGEFASFSGAIFPEFSRAIHVCDPKSEDVLDSMPAWICSIDWGFTNPFCMLWAARDSDGDIFVFHEQYGEQRLAQWHLEKAIRTFKRKPLRTWADPENAEDRAVFDYGGWPTLRAKKDVWPSIEAVSRWLMPREGKRPRLTISSDCVNLIREIQRYRVPPANKRLGINIKEEPLKKEDHAVDALRYLVYNEQWCQTDYTGMESKPQPPSWRQSIFRQAGLTNDDDTE